jgi:MinD superfamily P-loop ATPase
MDVTITIASGKGGTGKTFVSTNLSRVFEKMGNKVHYLDCDVEEPNGHLFLKPTKNTREDVTLMSPVAVDTEKCTACGKCVEACTYNALALIKENILVFKNLCHVCGACTIVCPHGAVIEKERKIGELFTGKSRTIDIHYALLETGEGAMTPRLIREVKNFKGQGINIIDAPPGTSCPAVESVKESDLCVLVTDPTPFGIHDLKLAVQMCRELGQEPVIIVNRADYKNDDLKYYCNEQELHIIGEIPDDRNIAESYSVGDIIIDRIPEYKTLFATIADNIITAVSARKNNKTESFIPGFTENQKNLAPGTVESGNRDARETEKALLTECQPAQESKNAEHTKELVIISGKGGTGKTTLAGAFAALAQKSAISDCDVDAADLHLIIKPAIVEQGFFSGGKKASIDPEKCRACGSCKAACKFNAVKKITEQNKVVYKIDPFSCEGCGVCTLVCGYQAVSMDPVINGEWFSSRTSYGPMSHAALGIAEENSGKLVSLIRNKQKESAARENLDRLIIDGSPGTGCPVIASITGADYAIVVTEPTVSGIHDLKRILDVIDFFHIKAGIIVNKYDINPGKSGEIKDITEEKQADFLGEIPYNTAMTRAQMEGISIVEYGRGREDLAPFLAIVTKIWETIVQRIKIE